MRADGPAGRPAGAGDVRVSRVAPVSVLPRASRQRLPPSLGHNDLRDTHILRDTQDLCYGGGMTEGFPMPALMVLGPLRLRGEAGEAALGGIKPRRLLAVLALNAGEIVSADRLIDVVWNDLPPHSARQNLQTYVWFLRRLLAAAGRDRIRIEAQPPGYLLRAARGELDLHVFRSLSSAGAACLASDPARATKLLGEATALWRGPALDNLADGLPSLRPRIAALEEARLTALDQRIQADLALGRHREIVGELAELAGLYPLFEQFRAHQMVALYRCGRQAEALAVFGDLRRELAEELGIDPGPGLRRLRGQALRQKCGPAQSQ